MAQLEGLEAKNHSSQVNDILERRNMSTADTAFLCVLDTKKKEDRHTELYYHSACGLGFCKCKFN